MNDNTGREIVAIIGSREYPDLNEVRDFVRSLPMSTVVVTGAWWDAAGHQEWKANPTRGVDRVAAFEAKRHGCQVILVPADGNGPYGKSAGLRRNPVIIDVAHRVVAFWDGQSGGTLAGIKYAQGQSKPCEVRRPGE